MVTPPSSDGKDFSHQSIRNLRKKHLEKHSLACGYIGATTGNVTKKAINNYMMNQHSKVFDNHRE